MTLKEKVEQMCPEAIDEDYVGGVEGCPRDYDFLLNPQPNCVGNCWDCWNREYKEPAKE